MIKNLRRHPHDIFLRIEGGHLMNTNWLVKTVINIDLKVCNAIQLVTI